MGWWAGATRVLILVCLSGAVAPLAASQEEWVARAVAEVGANMEREFALPPDLQIPSALRSQFENLRQEHLARAKALLQEWAVAEAARLAPDEVARSLNWRLQARYTNEVALWHLDTLGPEFEQRLLKALLRPGICAGQHERSVLARVAWLAAGLDAADQAQFVADQRALLVVRWGATRSKVPVRPEITVQSRVVTLLRKIKTQGSVDEPPLPPVAAWALARSADGQTRRDMECPLHQWWLKRELAKPGVDRQAALTALRFADIRPPATRNERDVTDGYPLAARGFGVEGVVRVKGRVGPAGLLDAQVVHRAIRVPGLGGQPPVAFETIFDDTSLARAATTRSDQPQGREATMDFVWKLTP